MSTEAEAFGKRLVKTLGEGPSRASLLAQEEAVVRAAFDRTGVRASWFGEARALAMALAGVAVVGLAALLLVNLRATAVYSHTTQSEVAQHAAGVTTQTSSPETLTLPDGSTVLVAPGSRAELKRSGPRHTEIALVRGQIDLDMRKQNGAHFAVAAGPYRVLVVGTRFRVTFDDTHQDIVVSVSEGVVRVFGEGLPHDGQPVPAGTRFERSRQAPGSQRVEPTHVATAEPDAAATNDAQTLEITPKRSEQAQPGRDPKPVSSWQQLAQAGRYGEAYALADRLGFEALLGELSASDLLMLANSTRFAGHPTRAAQAFHRLRERFAGHPTAVLASFYLARIALDNSSDPRSAARWFRTYLNEAPSGQLSAGARVDLINILLKLGDRAGARRVAEDYVKYHPNGAHLDVARSLVNQTGESP